jgi:hypothetical protein
MMVFVLTRTSKRLLVFVVMVFVMMVFVTTTGKIPRDEKIRIKGTTQDQEQESKDQDQDNDVVTTLPTQE